MAPWEECPQLGLVIFVAELPSPKEPMQVLVLKLLLLLLAFLPSHFADLNILLKYFQKSSWLNLLDLSKVMRVNKDQYYKILKLLHEKLDRFFW